MATVVEKIVDHYNKAMDAGGISFCFLLFKRFSENFIWGCLLDVGILGSGATCKFSIGLMCLSTSGYYTQVEILTGNS